MEEAAEYHIEERVMEEGFHSCFGCVHHEGDRSICRRCNVLTPQWEPNERWGRARKGRGG